MKFKISESRLGKGLVRVRGRSDDGQMMVRWSGERQGNLNLSLTLVDVKLVDFTIIDGVRSQDILFIT